MRITDIASNKWFNKCATGLSGERRLTFGQDLHSGVRLAKESRIGSNWVTHRKNTFFIFAACHVRVRLTTALATGTSTTMDESPTNAL